MVLVRLRMVEVEMLPVAVSLYFHQLRQMLDEKNPGYCCLRLHYLPERVYWDPLLFGSLVNRRKKTIKEQQCPDF